MPLFNFKMRLFHDLFPVLVLALHIHAIPKMHRAYVHVTHSSSMLDFEDERDLRQFVCVHVEHKYLAEVWRKCVVSTFGGETAQLFATESDVKFNKRIYKGVESALESL